MRATAPPMSEGSTRTRHLHVAAGGLREAALDRLRTIVRQRLRRHHLGAHDLPECRTPARGTPPPDPPAGSGDRARRGAPAASRAPATASARPITAATAPRLRGAGMAGFISTCSKVGCCLRRSMNSASSRSIVSRSWCSFCAMSNSARAYRLAAVRCVIGTTAFPGACARFHKLAPSCDRDGELRESSVCEERNQTFSRRRTNSNLYHADAGIASLRDDAADAPRPHTCDRERGLCLVGGPFS